MFPLVASEAWRYIVDRLYNEWMCSDRTRDCEWVFVLFTSIRGRSFIIIIIIRERVIGVSLKHTAHISTKNRAALKHDFTKSKRPHIYIDYRFTERESGDELHKPHSTAWITIRNNYSMSFPIKKLSIFCLLQQLSYSTNKEEHFSLGTNSYCLLACILLAYWLFINTCTAHINASFCINIF